MEEIRILSRMIEKDKIVVIEFFKIFDSYFSQIGEFELKGPEYELDLLVYPNWACAWNKLEKIGEEARIIAQRGQLSMVIFADGTANIYRNEDLTKLLTINTEIDASNESSGSL